VRWTFVREGYGGTLHDGSGTAAGRLHASVVSTATPRLLPWPLRSAVVFTVTDDFSPLFSWPASLTRVRVHARSYLLPCARADADNLARELRWWSGAYTSDQVQLLPAGSYDAYESLSGSDVQLRIYLHGDDVVSLDVEYGSDPVRHVFWRKGAPARHGAYDLAPQNAIHPAATLEATYRGKIPPETVATLKALPYKNPRHRDGVLAALAGLL